MDGEVVIAYNSQMPQSMVKVDVDTPEGGAEVVVGDLTMQRTIRTSIYPQGDHLGAASVRV